MILDTVGTICELIGDSARQLHNDNQLMKRYLFYDTKEACISIVPIKRSLDLIINF